jgi:Uri superfamily endonuclease
MSNITIIPKLPGTYALIVRIETPLTLTVGKLGLAKLPAGLVVYIGSAHGPGGLQSRIARHLRREKVIHWHIDAVTAHAPVIMVWYAATSDRLECNWAHTAASTPGIRSPVPGFGASDCSCQTHLFALRDDDHVLQTLWQHLNRPTQIKP